MFAARTNFALHFFEHEPPPRFLVFGIVVQRGEGRLDLLEHGGNFEQLFPDQRAVPVDARARELFFPEFSYLFRIFIQKFFGQQRKQQAGDERHEHGQVKGGTRKGPRRVIGAVKIGQVPHRHVREEHGERGGELSRAQKRQRERAIQHVFGAYDKLRRGGRHALADCGRGRKDQSAKNRVSVFQQRAGKQKREKRRGLVKITSRAVVQPYARRRDGNGAKHEFFGGKATLSRAEQCTAQRSHEHKAQDKQHGRHDGRADIIAVHIGAEQPKKEGGGQKEVQGKFRTHGAFCLFVKEKYPAEQNALYGKHRKGYPARGKA